MIIDYFMIRGYQNKKRYKKNTHVTQNFALKWRLALAVGSSFKSWHPKYNPQLLFRIIGDSAIEDV